MVTITNRIDEKLKKALDKFCEEHGLKQQSVISEALASWLEDAQDLDLIVERRNGPWVNWEDVKDNL
jgi:predicted transcriptional regulator